MAPFVWGCLPINVVGYFCFSKNIGILRRDDIRIIIAVVAMAMLAVCMAPTMNEAREEGPYKGLTSKKAAAALAEYTVFTEGSQYFVDIQPQGTGSVAKYYAVVGNWIANKG